ncbi:hypothetical protein AGDE_05461 [Angomonas deanei]|uniref:Vesicle transport protein n=1 Tax=Angomonas deanei TaxID=59799 RepID=A0A7G2BZY2_9TRYP|nr:hypothetical protein AGDE_05461 [Angomonas deanei]CAD2213069.1 Got1/Sft2-like family, putative [Angomonas deanei]|eukprot:EPY38468.1 hypothetical protein AGDE_05461 [Angomonas deanei]
MTKIHRLIPTLVFVVSIVLTFIMAFAAKVPGLTILFIFIQYFSLAWYCITYIPFAKEGILRCFGCRR